ncbi:MAG: C40 family peptidase [Proteobacteria bacterium]|nr:C40 family peptidase [Pseudomonadota bacterium]
MHKQLRPLFLKTCTGLVYILIVILSTSLAFGMETKPAYSLSAVGLTDQEFENRLNQYVGIPYRKGGTTTKGLDCSGFVRLVYDQIFGIDLPHSSMAQFTFSDLKKIDKNDIQSGDLIFFSNKGKKRINHVGVYLSDNKFIHASSSEGITVSGLDERYWKKRFVGTKRHEYMSSDFDSGQVRFESTFQIPLHDNGSLISYTREDFSTSAWTIQREMENPAFEPLNLDDSRQYLHEIGYAHTLSEGFDINITTIHENFEVYSTWPEFTSETQDSGYLTDDDLSGTTADRMGFKLAGIFTPSLWLSLVPSITFYDYARENEDILNAPEWMFGLNTVLLPANQQWSLSMMLQYSEKDDFRDLSFPYRGFSSMGLAVRLGVRLTENFNFSIMGEHDKYSTVYGIKGDSQIMDYRSSNVSMAFGFSY